MIACAECQNTQGDRLYTYIPLFLYTYPPRYTPQHQINTK